MKPTANLYEDEWSAEIYDYEVQRVGELPLWQSLAESAGGPVLELACGTGRLVLPLRYFFRCEMEWMLQACGFELQALYGSSDRSAFTSDSLEMIFVARKAG